MHGQGSGNPIAGRVRGSHDAAGRMKSPVENECLCDGVGFGLMRIACFNLPAKLGSPQELSRKKRVQFEWVEGR
jgi:hypothetical protein